MYLFQKGQQRGVDAQGRPLRKGFTPEAVLRVMLQEGQVPVCDYVRLRVRYFVDGVVMGTRQFVDEVFQAYRRRFGPKRKDGARRMRGVACEGLYVLRDLRRNVIGFHQPMDWGDLGTVPGTGEGARLTGVIRNWFRPAPTRLFVMACARSGRRSLSAALAATHSSRNSRDTVGAEFKTTELT
jgi:hypothetical protein